MVYVVTFVAVVIIILWGISLYLIKKEKISAQNWSMRSLGLPQGSVRAIIALMLLFSVVYSIMTGIEIPDLPDWLVGIMGTVIGFYFGTALMSKPKQDEETKPKSP